MLLSYLLSLHSNYNNYFGLLCLCGVSADDVWLRMLWALSPTTIFIFNSNTRSIIYEYQLVAETVTTTNISAVSTSDSGTCPLITKEYKYMGRHFHFAHLRR